jgi:KRAB domain-containing zinc finger protein
MGPEAGSKMFFCGACGYTTRDSSNARRHYLKHTSEKSLTCPYCHYVTTRKDALARHIAATHCARNQWQ